MDSGPLPRTAGLGQRPRATIVLVAAATFGLSLTLALRHELALRLRRSRPPACREAVSGDAPASGRGAAPAAR